MEEAFQGFKVRGTHGISRARQERTKSTVTSSVADDTSRLCHAGRYHCPLNPHRPAVICATATVFTLRHARAVSSRASQTSRWLEGERSCAPKVDGFNLRKNQCNNTGWMPVSYMWLCALRKRACNLLRLNKGHTNIVFPTGVKISIMDERVEPDHMMTHAAEMHIVWYKLDEGQTYCEAYSAGIKCFSLILPSSVPYVLKSRPAAAAFICKS